jgi:hypothetical protein
MREAQRAGAIPVGFGSGYRPASALLQAGAVAVVDDLSMVLEILAGSWRRLSRKR